MGLPASAAPEALPVDKLKTLFRIIFFMQIFINFDSGAVPVRVGSPASWCGSEPVAVVQAVLDVIKEDVGFGPLELGLLGGMKRAGGPQRTAARDPVARPPDRQVFSTWA